MQCTAQRQQKAANTSLLESKNLLQTASLVFPRLIICSRLSNNINILAKKLPCRQRGAWPPPGPGLDPPLVSLCNFWICVKFTTDIPYTLRWKWLTFGVGGANYSKSLHAFENLYSQHKCSNINEIKLMIQMRLNVHAETHRYTSIVAFQWTMNSDSVDDQWSPVVRLDTIE